MTAIKHNVADLIWKSPGSEIELISLTMDQAISELYTIRAEIKCEEKGLKFADMLHAEAEIVIKCGEELADDRILSGIITRFAQKRTRFGNLPNASGKRHLYEVEIRPAMWMTTRQHRSLVFQQKSAKDIVSEVLDGHGVAYEWRLQGAPPIKEYCLQYQESDYAFISRLLEEAGVCFFFDQKKRKVIFSDHPGGHPECKPTAKAMYVEEISPRFQFGKQEFIRDFCYEEIVATGVFAVHHYNYETSQTNIKTQKQDGKAPCFTEVERYQHSLNYKDKGAGDAIAKRLLEEEISHRKVGRGFSSSRSFEAGYAMTMTDHFRDEFNVKWLLTSCSITMSQGGYQCEFTCLPADIPFRPARKTPPPKATGIQTAVVTGPSGSKVYLDEMGRCKLQFHWDREGGKDERASMWVRVSQNYAGKGYGIQWIPRVGDEVLVTFINGDPDMPIVTGRVYNDFNTAPLGPANKWQNIIKTIKDHHIIFDDEDGKEVIDIRSHKDMKTLVVNSKSLNVGNDETISIGDARSITVGGRHSESIGKNMTINISDNLSETVGGNYTESVSQSLSLSVGKSMSETISDQHSLSVGKSKSENIGEDATLTAGKGYRLQAVDDVEMQSGKKTLIRAGDDISIKGNKKGTIEVKDQLVLKCGKASITLKKNGDILIKGKKINLKASSDIVMKGSKIKQN